MSSIFGAGGVSKIIAGSGISLSPTNGKGDVTISTSFSGVAVTSFNNRTGAVSLASADVTAALGYTPAGLASPSFTGTPLVPTAAFGTSTTQIASTAFVQFAVSASVAGVSSFNTRTGAVTLTFGDITGTLGYTPAAVNSPALTGVPTAPTASPGTDTTQLATTAFVHAAVVASTTGVASFNTRTGAVTLTSADVISALQTGANAAPILITTTPTYQDNASFTIKRLASTATLFPLAPSAAFKAHTVVSSTNTNFEWGIWSYLENSASNIGENVAIYGQADRKTTSTKTTWAGVFEVCDLTNTANTAGAQAGAAVAMEVDVWCNGTDLQDSINSSFVQTIHAGRIGIDLHCGNAQQIRNGVAGIGQGRAFSAIRVTGSDGGVFYNALAIQAAADAGIYNYSAGSFWGIRHTGQYVIGIDLSEATHTSGIALRLKTGDAISFDGTSQYQMKLNASSGLLEFYNGATRHGYINIASGADVNFNSSGGGSSGVTSFNSRTGAITLTSADITTVLGYTPANNSSTVDLTSIQTMTGYKIFSGGIASNTDILLGSACTVNFSSASNVTFSAGAGASSLPSNPVFFLRIVIDGTPYKIPVYNS